MSILAKLGTTTRVIIGIVLVLTVVLLPTGVALLRRHNNFMPILLTNILLGWVFGLGWIVALIWSFTSNVKEKRSIKELLVALREGTLEDEKDL